MKIVSLGGGYVGGTTMTVIADRCPDIEVHVYDLDARRVDAWNSDNIPICEPGLDEVVFRVRGKNLFFTTDDSVLADADIIFISVNSPTKDYGLGAGRAADLKYIESCSRRIAQLVKSGHKLVVEKSTVPVRCAAAIRKVFDGYKSENGATFSILSNPEFLTEGTALRDVNNPDRVLIGGETDKAGQEAVTTLVNLYARYVPRERILTMNLWSSELTKIASSAMLAQRVSSINSISAVCEVTGADVQEVSRGIGADSRITSRYLNASIGFGGSSHKKDLLTLVYLCETLHLPEVADYWNQVVAINEYQRSRFTKNIVKMMLDTVSGKTFAIFGFAYKKDTGDARETSAIPVCANLLAEGAILRIYDPKVSEVMIEMELERYITDERTKALMKKNVTCCKTADEAVAANSHAIVILTEWDEFKTLNYESFFQRMIKPAFIFDGRLILDQAQLRKIGFISYCVGKPTKFVK